MRLLVQNVNHPILSPNITNSPRYGERLLFGIKCTNRSWCWTKLSILIYWFSKIKLTRRKFKIPQYVLLAIKSTMSTHELWARERTRIKAARRTQLKFSLHEKKMQLSSAATRFKNVQSISSTAIWENWRSKKCSSWKLLRSWQFKRNTRFQLSIYFCFIQVCLLTTALTSTFFTEWKIPKVSVLI